MVYIALKLAVYTLEACNNQHERRMLLFFKGLGSIQSGWAVPKIIPTERKSEWAKFNISIESKRKNLGG